MANTKTFEVIFNNVLSYVARCTFARDRESNRRITSFLCKSIENSKDAIKMAYARINSETKRDYMQHGEDIKLDRHKCTAAFMIAFLERLVLDIDVMKKLDKSLSKSNLIREKLAIDIGIMIVVTMIKDNDCDRNRKIIDFLNKNDNMLKFPEVESDDNPYAKNWALELHYARLRRKLFVLSLSNELFCIEKYNRLLAAAS